MKKFLSILLLLPLLLSLSVSVFARYEVCPECEGRMEYETKEVRKAIPCSQMEDGDGTDYRVTVSERLSCTVCDYHESWEEIYTYIECSH